MNDAAIRAGLESLLKAPLLATSAQSVSGGSIHQCFRYFAQDHSLFVKIAPSSSLDMLAAEAAGLQILQQAAVIRVPAVLGYCVFEEQALLALEWIDLQPASPASDALLGEQLAKLHRVTRPLYGWHSNNYIGSTPQINWWSKSWINFWREHRFEAQLNRAIENKAPNDLIERATLLHALIDGFFTSHQPIASLLHGDLWTGNRAMDASGSPIIFDPAMYFGDRECDIAMTCLFGSFRNEFYDAYEQAWPLDSGWQQRADLYNLYHLFNHFNLFGESHLQQVDQSVNRLLAELGH